jgi:hypothetical protein
MVRGAGGGDSFLPDRRRHGSERVRRVRTRRGRQTPVVIQLHPQSRASRGGNTSSVDAPTQRAVEAALFVLLASNGAWCKDRPTADQSDLRTSDLKTHRPPTCHRRRERTWDQYRRIGRNRSARCNSWRALAFNAKRELTHASAKISLRLDSDARRRVEIANLKHRKDNGY